MATFSNYRNWADLQRELLGLVLKKLVLLPDYIHFGAVCKGWRFAALDNYLDRLRTCYQQPPMILLPPEVGNEDRRRLYSICEGKTYPHSLTIPNTKRFCGSSYGWLALADGRDLSITLFNPVSGKTIQLRSPRIRCDLESPFRFESDSEFRVHSVTLSCDPCLNPNDWVAVAIYGPKNRLAFMRAGHGSWYYAIEPIKEDVVAVGFYKGHLYLMTRCYSYWNGADKVFRIAMEEEDGWRGDMWSVRSRSVKRVKELTRLHNHGEKSYFLKLGEDLLVVRRRYGHGRKATIGFDVYKLHLEENQSSTVDCRFFAAWIEVHDLGGFSLFLGENKPICIYAATFPNCKPNCIYYLPDCSSPNDNSSTKVDDVGVFDLATRRIDLFDTVPSLKKSMPSAVWFSPKLG